VVRVQRDTLPDDAELLGEESDEPAERELEF